RAALNKAFAELVFKVGETPRKGGVWQTGTFRGPRETAGVDHVGEQDQVVRVKADGVHGRHDWSKYGIIIVKNCCFFLHFHSIEYPLSNLTRARRSDQQTQACHHHTSHESYLHPYRGFPALAGCSWPGRNICTGLLHGRPAAFAQQAEAVFMAQVGGREPVRDHRGAPGLAPDTSRTGSAGTHEPGGALCSACRPLAPVCADAGDSAERLAHEFGARVSCGVVWSVAAARPGGEERRVGETASDTARGAELHLAGRRGWSHWRSVAAPFHQEGRRADAHGALPCPAVSIRNSPATTDKRNWRTS